MQDILLTEHAFTGRTYSVSRTKIRLLFLLVTGSDRVSQGWPSLVRLPR